MQNKDETGNTELTNMTEHGKVEELLRVRLKLMEYAAGHSLEEVLQKTLDEIGDMVGSPIGFYHFVERDQKSLTLQAWSSRTVREFCTAQGKGMHYSIDEAGVWADCVYQRTPVIHNDYASLPHRKGMPEGHALVVREMVLPIFRSGQIVAILGVGNKPTDYTEKDVELVTYLADVAWEIAERKQAEEKLHWFNDLMKYVISHAQSAIAVHDRDMKYIYVSDNYLQQYKVREKDVIGKHHYDIFPDLPQKWRDVHQRVLAGAVESADEDPYVREDGSVDWTRWECRPWHEYDGSIGGLIVYTEVITERVVRENALRLSEERFRSIVSTSQEWIWAIDSSGCHTYSNPTIEKILGYRPDEIVGHDALHLLHDEDLPQVKQLFARCIEQKTGWSNLILRWKHKDGTWRYLESNAVPIWDNTGVLTGFQGSDRDITERKHAEEEKEKLQAQLLQAQKMEAIGHLAGGIAHDFNNILSAIVGYAHLLLINMDDDDPMRINIEHILASSERAANLTRSLLTFSRQQLMQVTPLNINKIVSGMTKILERIIGEDIELKVETTVQDLIVTADKNQMELVLMNLAANARDAMPDGGTLTIRTEEARTDDACIGSLQSGESGKYAVLSVTDTGTGMDEKTRENIFDPFFTTKEVGKGTGLGLAMLYGTVKQHEGFIHVSSEPGKGTTFRIYLPLTVPEAEVTEKKVPSTIPPGTETVLLVEDDEAVRSSTTELLKAYGYIVLEAGNAKQAIDLYRENKDTIELVITDIIMPGRSGKNLYNELMLIKSDLKILFISGYPADSLVRRDIINSEVNFVSKPFRPEVLLKKVRAILGK